MRGRVVMLCVGVSSWRKLLSLVHTGLLLLCCSVCVCVLPATWRAHTHTHTHTHRHTYGCELFMRTLTPNIQAHTDSQWAVLSWQEAASRTADVHRDIRNTNKNSRNEEVDRGHVLVSLSLSPSRWVCYTAAARRHVRSQQPRRHWVYSRHATADVRRMCRLLTRAEDSSSSFSSLLLPVYGGPEGTRGDTFKGSVCEDDVLEFWVVRRTSESGFRFKKSTFSLILVQTGNFSHRQHNTFCCSHACFYRFLFLFSPLVSVLMSFVLLPQVKPRYSPPS